ncbi:hypothetical protein OG897_30220 [Streptomyces sp. NBC_00237]|uniref:hypothetical protein n=1 Tax=Streptomyces sp. NBC_00237 TaxID=2975687 RepID=UPI0022584862|nr:hypothetical protein [Streptomyces sp. NBC_00237]MCX5205716.1 hypothetical protein [Streptomyces sp. NBC_00237]
MTQSTEAACGVLAVTSAPTAPSVSEVVPQLQDLAYDPRTALAALPVEVRFRDGTAAEAVMVMDPGQLERAHAQIGRVLDARAKSLGLA